MQVKSLVSLGFVAAATAATIQPANQTDHLIPIHPPPPPPPPKPPAHGPPPPPPHPKPPKGPLPGSPESIRNLKEKIKHVIVLVMENRAYDHLLGGQTKKGMNNPLQQGPFCLPVNITDPSNKDMICTAPKDFDSITHDPDHGLTGNNLEFYGTFNPDNEAIQSGHQKPVMNGFVTKQIIGYGGKSPNASLIQQLGQEVMGYYTEDQVPTITSTVQNFFVFDRLFSGFPGPTNPNRLYVTSGTSNGNGANNFPAGSQPQMSIFEKLDENRVGWRAYTEDDSTGDVRYYKYFSESDNANRVLSMDEFFDDVITKRLQPFSYLVPSCCGVGTNSMHPQGLVDAGEKLIKDLYDTVRNSDYWESVLLYITFDETGGFYDHVAPPLATPPDNLTYTTTTSTGQNYTFAFDRLGGRLPTFGISPWLPNDVEGQGIGPDGKPAEYSATSLLRTLGYLWDFEPFNPRVKESASFDHHFLTKMRTDTPQVLPDGLPFTPSSG